MVRMPAIFPSVHGWPSLPHLSVSWTYSSLVLGRPQWNTWRTSGQSMPIPNAVVAMTIFRVLPIVKNEFLLRPSWHSTVHINHYVIGHPGGFMMSDPSIRLNSEYMHMQSVYVRLRILSSVQIMSTRNSVLFTWRQCNQLCLNHCKLSGNHMWL